MKNCDICWDCDGADDCEICEMFNDNYNPCEDCEERETCNLIHKDLT